MLTDTEGLEYYKHVDEVTQNIRAFQEKALQVHGFVTPGSITKWFDEERGHVHYQFQIENCGKTLQAHFRGMVPDMFRDGAEVVVKGKIVSEPVGMWNIQVK